MTSTAAVEPDQAEDPQAPAAPRLIGPYLAEGRVRGSATYEDPVEPGIEYHSVTTVISACTAKPWLVPWSAKLAATYAVEKFDLVSMLITESGAAAAIDHVSREAMRKREAAADVGTIVHDYVEALVRDTALPALPEGTDPDGDLAKMLDAFLDWHVDFDPVYLMSEATVCNPRDGWAGTLDLIAYLPAFDQTFLIDAKSGQNLDAWMPVQLGTYASATEVWLPFGQKARMPRVDRAAVLHLRPEGYKMIPVEIDPVDPTDEPPYDVFRRMLRQYAWSKSAPRRIGRPLYPPLPDGSQPPPLLEDLDDVPARGPLAAAGIRAIDHLAAFPPDKALALTGFGPGSLVKVHGLLTLHGLLTEPWAQAYAEHQAAEQAKAEKAAATAAKRKAAHAAGKHAAKPIRGCQGCTPVASVDDADAEPVDTTSTYVGG